MSKLFQYFECSSYFIFQKINKNYAFEIPGVPAECECLEIRYDVSTYIPISLPYSFMFMPSNIECDHLVVNSVSTTVCLFVLAGVSRFSSSLCIIAT